MAHSITPTHKDRPVYLPTKNNVVFPSQDKKSLVGRRHQRHSTEIGSEYHRWWIVRNILGCETNEHIAGLLLDGFHSVLQQLVIMSGGEMFDPKIHAVQCVERPGPAGGQTTSITGESLYTPGSSSVPSPPGIIEDLEEFVHYKSTIGHYCEYLWTTWVQQDRMQLILHNLSPPLQQFLVKLIGYIRTAKGKSQKAAHKQKRYRTSAKQSNKVERPDDQCVESPLLRSANVHPINSQEGQAFFYSGPSVSSQILHPATSLNKESKCFSTRGDEEFDHYQTAKKRRPLSKIQEPNCHSSPSTWSRSHQYVCQHCKLEFLSNMDLFLHNYDQHGLVCGECDSRFLSSSDLLKHKEMDHPPISCCKHCRYVTFGQDELNHHIKSAHNADQKTSDSSSNPCQELHENNENLASSSRTTQTGNFVSKTDSAIYTSLDVHGNSKPHLAAVSPFKQEKVVAMPSKHFLMHDVFSGPQQYYVGNVIDKHKQDHMESHNYKNTSSESEEPSLVIDTVDYCEVNKNKLDVVRSEQGDQPLCLVVHTRENVNLHHNIFQAEEQKDVRYQQQFCHTKPFTVNEMDRKVDFSKYFLGSTGRHEKNVSFQRHHETQFAIDSRMEQGTVNGSEAYEYSSTSIACFANCESSMNATGRDFWSAELVSSGDGQLLSNSGNIPGTNCNFGPTEDHKLNRAKPASDLSATDGISLNSPLTDSTSQNGNRDLILKNDATMSSLPPKKRGLRKSPGLSSSRSSETSRTLRDESIQDIMTENGQQTPNPNLSSEPKSTAEGERKQNMSPLAELERSSRGSETKPVYIGSKAPELKEPFSCENQRERKSNQPQNCEAASLTKSELDIKAEETQENTHTYSTALNSAKDSIGNYKCPVFSCSASFSRKWTMEVHLDSKHKKDSQHLAKCKFSTCCELRQHVQEGHRGKVRRHTCTWPECGKRFFARTHLHTHMLVHTGEKPVACQLCDYRCRQRTALIWHMRKHGVYGQRKEKVNSNESI